MIWITALFMIVIALLLLLFPLWIYGNGQITLDSNAANVAVLKEQLAELESDYSSGGMSKELYDAAREDLENSVAADLEESSAHKAAMLSSGSRRLTALVIAIVVPLSSILLYKHLTTFKEASAAHAMIANSTGSTGDSKAMPSVDQMVEGLAAKLRENPDDAEGWFMLGKSYAVLERIPEAVKAYGQAYRLLGDTDAQVMIDYAEVLSRANKNSMQGKPDELLKKALAIDPNNQKGIWLAGISAFEKGDFADAAAQWQRLISNPELSGENRQMLTKYIAEARQRAGLSVEQPKPQVVQNPASVSVQVDVALDNKLVEKAGSQDTVFVFARQPSGMPMPLAVARLKVSDLPTTVKLDETMAMMPGHSLADKEQVVIGARISKSGGPVSKSGDLEGLSAVINPKTTDKIAIVINKVVK